MTRVSYAVEGASDEAIAEILIATVGREPWRRFTSGGKSRLDPKLPGYNRSAERQPWLVLRDLDDAPCPASLVHELIGGGLSAGFALRIPVRAIESWLLADRKAFAAFFRVAVRRVPDEPDTLEDPKTAVIDLCRASTSSAIRSGMVPTPRSGRRVGREYVAMIREYAMTSWRVDVAESTSPSLGRSIARLRDLVAAGAW